MLFSSIMSIDNVMFNKELSLLLFKICQNKENIKCLILKKNVFGCSDKSEICTIACDIGDLFLLKYAHNNECQYTDDTIHIASMKGQLSCLKYLHEHWMRPKDNIDYDNIITMAGNGHLDCIQYVYEQGYKLHHRITLYAAMGGYLSILKYAYEHGSGLDESAAFGAANNGHIDCLNYIHHIHLQMADKFNTTGVHPVQRCQFFRWDE